MGRSVDENSVIKIVEYECGEFVGLAKEIGRQIKALPSAEPERWSTCFDCPLSHGCPVIKGCTNEQAMQYAGEIPNDCPQNKISEEPERKRGRWYKPTGMMPPEYAGRHRCSECDGFAMHDWKTHREVLTDFCPWCGADMRGGQDE